MSGELKNLFSPISVNRMELRNRAVMPAMATGYATRDGVVTERLVAYLARRAAGGTGLIITEVCAVDPRGRGLRNQVGIWSDEFISGLKKIPESIHREGGKAAAQLHHAGRETFKALAGAEPEAPSPIPSVVLQRPCEEMSLGRVREMVEAFAKAALRAREAGFDAVEIHGAHGYLVNQFLSPFSNWRTDEYGGSDERRARFAIEIIKGVRRAVGSDFPVIIRVSTEELVKGGYDLAFMKWLAPRLVEAGVDAIHASVAVYSTPGNLSIASMDTEPGFNLHRARAVRGVVDVPVIGVGRVHDPRLAEEAIARGDADLVSFGRQHLCDPDFLSKARRGDFDDIRFCLACNQGCIERLTIEMKSTTCSINPGCGKEFEPKPEKVEKPKRVWVVGAGPAGLSAALSSAGVGHRVEVFERDEEPGGQIRPASRPPNKDVFSDWVKWAVRRLEKGGVRVKCNQEVTAGMLRAERPDVVVLASGASPVVPDIPGIRADHVFDARDVLMGKVKLKNPAVILGAGYVGMETADFLVSRGIEVTLLEMKPAPPLGRQTAHGYWLNRRLKHGGSLVLGANVTRIEKDAVVYTREGKEDRVSPAAMVVTALGASPEKGLLKILDKLGIPHHVIGDAKKPRRILEAVHEGFEVCREL